MRQLIVVSKYQKAAIVHQYEEAINLPKGCYCPSVRRGNYLLSVSTTRLWQHVVNDRYTALTVDSVLSPLKEKASGEGPVADGRQLRIAL